MIHEVAFALEAGACSRVAPKLLPAITRHRVPRFGVVGKKIAQIVANRPDVRVPFDDGGVIRDTLACVVGDERGGPSAMRASVATVTRSPCGRLATKTCNDRGTPAFLDALSFIVRTVDPEMDRCAERSLERARDLCAHGS